MDEETLTPEETRKIVDNLVAGGSLAKIPEEYHPQLLMPLSAAKNEAIVAGNAALVKRIQNIMKSLKLGTEKTRSPSARAKSAKTREIRSETIDEPINPLIDELLEGRPTETVDDTQLTDVIQALKMKKEELAQDGDYRKLQVAENIIQELNSRQYEATYTFVQGNKLANLKKQLNDTKFELKNKQQMWGEQRAAFEEEYQNAREDLINDQQQELQEYDSSFPEILPANFRKLSPQVLQLREQEKHLVLTKRYEDAIFYRERADRLEQQELEQQRSKFVRAFQVKRNQLIETQKTQLSCFEKHWERRLALLDKESNEDMKPLKTSIRNLQKRIDAIDVGIDEPLNAPSRGRVTSRSVMNTTPLKRSTMRSTPAAVNPRVRSVAASKMTSKVQITRVYPLR